jgi:hypothetical protein
MPLFDRKQSGKRRDGRQSNVDLGRVIQDKGMIQVKNTPFERNTARVLNKPEFQTDEIKS